MPKDNGRSDSVAFITDLTSKHEAIMQTQGEWVDREIELLRRMDLYAAASMLGIFYTALRAAVAQAIEEEVRCLAELCGNNTAGESPDAAT